MARKKAEPIMAEPVTGVPVEDASVQKDTQKTKKKAAARKKGTVFGGVLNVRKEPDVQSDRVRYLQSGTEVTILEDLGEWLRIEDGYIMAKWVK